MKFLDITILRIHTTAKLNLKDNRPRNDKWQYVQLCWVALSIFMPLKKLRYSVEVSVEWALVLRRGFFRDLASHLSEEWNAYLSAKMHFSQILQNQCQHG